MLNLCNIRRAKDENALFHLYRYRLILHIFIEKKLFVNNQSENVKVNCRSAIRNSRIHNKYKAEIKHETIRIGADERSPSKIDT